MMHRIECDPGRFRSRRQGPARHHFVFRRVNHRHLALVLEIYVNLAGRIVAHPKFRRTAELNRRYHLRVLRIDYRSRVSFVIKNVDLAVFRVVSERIRTIARVDLRSRLQRREIDHTRFVFSAVG